MLYKSILRFKFNKDRFISACERDGWLLYERRQILPSPENGYPITGGVKLTFCKPASPNLSNTKKENSDEPT